MNLPAFDQPAPGTPAPQIESHPMEVLFVEQFHEWVESESLGPRSPGFDAVWEEAVLAPARHTLALRGKHFRASLTTAAWSLAGGRFEDMPATIPLIVEILHAGSLIVDDVQDDSLERRGSPTLHRIVGMPLAINTGNLLYCWALDLLSQMGFAPGIELALYRRVSKAMLRCHHGQGLDLSVRITEMPPHLVPNLVKTTTQLKAGALMELAAAIGAIAGGGTREQTDAIAEFGNELGCGLQMLDDLSGVLNPKRRHKAIEDIGLARPTWPWAWLARDLDAETFGGLQDRARGVRTPTEIEALVVEIADLVRCTCKERVHAHLTTALALLRQRCGGHPCLDVVESEIERLEKAYV